MEIESIYDVKSKDNIDFEYLTRIQQIIKGQYEEFNNLGINMIDQIELKYQVIIIDDFFEYVHKYYTPVINYDQAMITPNVKYIIGYKTYQFFSTDFYLTIFPSFLDGLNIKSSKQLYQYIEKQCIDGNYNLIKTDIIKCIKTIYDNVKKLENIDKNISNDKSFKELLNKYSFYIKLINFGDISNFINNFCLPMFEKNEDDIIWKLS